MMKQGRKVHSEPQKRDIEVRIISADDLEDVKRFGKMRCYAVAYIDPHHKTSTQVDDDGGINPVWNEKLLLQADEDLLSDMMAAMTVDIYARGHIRDKVVGTARILIADVIKGGDFSDYSNDPVKCIAVQVWRPLGRPQGILNIWIPPTGRFLLRRLSLSRTARDESLPQVEEKAAESQQEENPTPTLSAAQDKTLPSPTEAE
uniref:TSA: Wollemia nobilis Ref_Wollemi_Transcript_13196_982 transcribed RNA sequence n=1 Tax=Wollemia nobilis TaxID=56998 RepID=A0A0C9S580_9CONI